jgi:ABC-2 type transport system permease protein
MKKILIIANREFWAIVGTKAFLLSLAIMPLMMFGGFLAIQLLQDRGGIEEKKLAVIDHSGLFAETLEKNAQIHNQALEQSQTAKPEEKPSEKTIRRGPPTVAKGTKYLIERIDSSDVSDQTRLDLSARVRKQDLHGFLEIPANVTETNVAELFSEDSGFSALSGWLNSIINERAKSIRFEQLGLNRETVNQATRPISLKSLGLLQVKSDGTIQAAEEKNQLTSMLLPLVFMMMMFMVIFMSAQPMLESVLEEKAQRIAEVLLGSVSPSQLMAGKLLGCVGGSLTIVVVYFGGAYVFAHQKGYTDLIPLSIIPWFIVFQILGVMLYSSIFMAIGASVSQLKEAQSMLLPVWILLMCPMFVWFALVQEPNGSFALGFSMFPPATPTTMVLRMATGVTIPVWQPIVGVVLLVITTSICVVIAGRIFRIGILWQGKTPKITELIRWAISG